MDEAQREFFSTKKREQTEIVITRFNETLDWTKGVEHVCTVYNKGAPFITKANCIDVPNNGAGLETILRHIITRYHTLSDITMFCQGNINDREDQIIFPFNWYFTDFDAKGIKGRDSTMCDFSDFRYKGRCDNDSCRAIGDRNLGKFREEVVGIPYSIEFDFFVRGDWISVTRECILKKPRAYYTHIYDSCRWKRGIFVEECWYLERSLYMIFTKAYDYNFHFPLDDTASVSQILDGR